MAKKINITAQLNAATTDGILADAGQIFDAKKGKFQEQVNEEFEDALEEAITSEETDMVVESIEEGIVHNALRKTEQILTEAEKGQARENIGAVSEQTFENEAVRVKKQVFTSEQKYQARHNISAITAEEAEKIAQDKINEASVSSPDKLQAVKELSSWLESNPDSAATMNAAIQENYADIQRLYRGTGIDEYSQFSTGMDYAAGDVVLYDGVLFRFKVEHAKGAWDYNEVEEWSEKKEREEKLSELGSKVDGNLIKKTIVGNDYVEFQYRMNIGKTYIIKNNESSNGVLNARSRQVSGVSLQNVAEGLNIGGITTFTPTIEGYILAVKIVGGGSFEFSEKDSIKESINNIEKDLSVVENSIKIAEENISDIIEKTNGSNCLDVVEKVQTDSIVPKAWFLGNNIQVKQNGRIKKVNLISASEGTITIYSVHKESETLFTVRAYQDIVVDSIGSLEIDTDLTVREGDYICVKGNNADILKYGNSVTDGWVWSTNPVITSDRKISLGLLPNYSVAFGWELESEVFVKTKNMSINWGRATIVNIPTDGGNFNMIGKMLNSITDASIDNPYIIKVPSGEWIECDIQGKKYVKIVGEGTGKTIVSNDGLSNYVTPSNYSYQEQAGKKLSEIAQQYKHIVFAKDDIIIEDLTIMLNNGKYCLHLDDIGFSNIEITNCEIIDNGNCLLPIGIGLRGGQRIVVENSVISRVKENGNGFYVHGSKNQSEGGIVEFVNCEFVNCGFATINEYGSTEEDIVNIINCHSTVGGSIDRGIEGADSSIPYNTKICCLGSNLIRVKRTGNPSTRPLCAKKIISEHFTPIKNNGYESGQILKGYHTGFSNVVNNSTDNILGIVDSVIDDVAYIIKKGVAFIPSDKFENIGTIGFGDYLYLSASGKLTNSTNGRPIAIMTAEYYNGGREVLLLPL